MSSETALAVVDFTTQQVDIIRNQIAKGASDADLALFLEVCKMTGLNPFQRQIYAVMRNAKDDGQWVKRMTIQTGIDGYRLVAARTGQLAGIDDPTYDRDDEEQPGRASVTVWRFVNGHRVPFTATARWREYAQYDREGKALQGMWGKMPYLMLGKCAEALALRKAFPAELSGVYTGEEMQQADADYPPASYVESVPAAAAKAPAPLREVKQAAQPALPRDSWADLHERAAKLGVKDMRAYVESLTGKSDPKEYKPADRMTVAKEVARREMPDFTFTVEDTSGEGEREGEIPSDVLRTMPVGQIGA